MTISTLLLIIALVLFIVAAFNIPSNRVSFGWLGAAFATAALLVSDGGLVG